MQIKKNLLESLKDQIIAHRGAPLLAPENTLSSFKMAASKQANWVEFDAQICASGEWVIIHDERLERTTNGCGLVQDTEYDTLKELDAGSWFHPKFKHERLPLLSETLIELSKLDLIPNIEIKNLEFTDQNDKTKLKHLIQFLEIIEQFWKNKEIFPLISSFELNSLKLLKSLDPNVALGYLIDEPIDFELLRAQLNQLKPFSLHCNYEHLPIAEFINLKKLDVSLLLYTINDSQLAKQYFDAGALAIFSDIPNLLK